MTPLTSAPGAASSAGEVILSASDIAFPQCDSDIGTVMTALAGPHLLDGVRVEALGVWPDDRGHFIEVQRIGCGLGGHFRRRARRFRPPSPTPAS